MKEIKRKKNVRWRIAILLCLVSGLNCLDRNTLAILASTIQAELNWTDADYANITAIFVFSYTLMYAFSGRIVDKIGTKKGFAIFAGSWSLVSMLHAFAGTISQFAIVRFFLGITESANFPAGVKACSEWFPIKERALSIGLFNAGTAIGAALAVPIVSFLAFHFGWRVSFFITGCLGFIWLFFWIKYYHLPQNHPQITEEERNLILQENDKNHGTEEEVKVSLRQLLLKKETWGCFSARIFIDPVTYFLLFWIPKYLQDIQGFSLAELGVTAWLPYTAMGVGTILGGALPKWLIDKHGWSLNKARKTIMLIASLVIPILCYSIFSGASPIFAVCLISGIMLSHGLWANITIPSEIYPKSVQATITGIGGTLGGITSVISQKAIGETIGIYSYLPVFIYIGIAYFISFILVSLLVGKLGIMKQFNNKTS
ncbi:MFS transporter [Parabacteroides sp. Marseille-P3160]|uniref:MFS transporter n=1 Tax=Parabacteroides sp. Marseille-P3160 TaxID=1917887 RepID=UPI0009BA202C|nr:MFS transporter [Parabacteroides sp. Marseille-P3160]